jgi:glycosyltransferase involved in cell wall biosynthesis
MKILHLGLCVSPPPINGLQKAFINNCDQYEELNCGDKAFNNKSRLLAHSFKPDLVFIQIQNAGILERETVKALQDNGAFVVNWNGDVRDDIPAWMLGTGVDLTLFSNMRDVHAGRKHGIKTDFLEIGYNPEIYCPEGILRPSHDIVFFGNNYGTQFPLSYYRNEMVKYLKGAFGQQFGVYGNGWQNANGNFNHSQVEEAQAYRGAKIAINCSHYDIERYSSDRIFRILGTGRPLCMARTYKGIEEDFEHGKHLITWTEFGDLEAKIRHYLKSENEREFIVKNGNILAKEKFTFDEMVKNLIKLYEKYKTI